MLTLSRRQPERDWTELQQRVRTWWIMAVVFAIAISLGRSVSLAFFASISFLALKEFLSMIPTRHADRQVLFWAYLAIPMQYLWAWYEWYGMFIIFIPVYVFLFLPMRMVLIGETRGFLPAVGTLHWGLMTTVLSLSHLAYLLVLPAPGNPNGSGPSLALYLVLLTQRTARPLFRPDQRRALQDLRRASASSRGWPGSVPPDPFSLAHPGGQPALLEATGALDAAAQNPAPWRLLGGVLHGLLSGDG